MDNTWIKLYRKILQNDDLFRSRNTFPVLCWLLLKVNRETGSTTIGRLNSARWLKMTPSSFYRALKKLESMHIIEQQSNNKWTTVTMTKWFIYQSKPTTEITDVNNKRNHDVRIADTIQEVRTKNKNTSSNTNTNVLVTDKPSELTLTKGQLTILRKRFPYQDVDQALQKFRAWQYAEGREFKNTLKRFEMWLLDDQKQGEKKTNAITEDPLFKRLIPLYSARIGYEWEAKNSLIERLQGKYERYKFKTEWEEAMKILRENDKVL